MQVEQIGVGDLIPYINNSRTHSDEQVMQVASSIKEFGFTNPILIDGEGGIIAGHGRLMAAKKLGLSEVPCIRLSHLTEAQRKAYVIADNQLALNGGWDFDLLRLELGGLDDLGFDVSVIGFGEVDLSSILFGEPEETISEEPLEHNYKEQYAVVIVCSDPSHQEDTFNKVVALGYDCKVVST